MSSPRCITVRTGALTPCCGRVPLMVRQGRYACRACGEVYRDAAELVRDMFWGAVDVTSSAPTRLILRVRWRG